MINKKKICLTLLLLLSRLSLYGAAERQELSVRELLETYSFNILHVEDGFNKGGLIGPIGMTLIPNLIGNIFPCLNMFPYFRSTYEEEGLLNADKFAENMCGEPLNTAELTNNNNIVATLDLSNKKLTNLVGLHYVEGIRYIKHLNLSGNQLVELPTNLLKVLSNLKALLLYNNELKELPSNFSNELSNLKFLLLSGNRLRNLPSNFSNGLSKLELLNLSGNELRNLPSNFSNEISNLKYLLLTGNQLEELPPNFLNGLTNLQYLDLSDNPISENKVQTLIEQYTHIGIVANKIGKNYSPPSDHNTKKA